MEIGKNSSKSNPVLRTKLQAMSWMRSAYSVVNICTTETAASSGGTNYQLSILNL